MSASGFLRHLWHWVRWPLLVLAIGYAALVAWDVNRLMNVDKTNAAVAEIHAQKLTLQDVLGTTIDYPIDEEANNATVAGIDSNRNGIRDDVEVAIFKKYPSDKKARAAALQYAMSLQLMITKVFDSGSWVAAVQEVTRGHNCIAKSFPRDGDFQTFINTINSRVKEVEDLVINTDLRKRAQEKSYTFTVGYGDDISGSVCDVDLNTLTK